ncbi:MAG: hypothetical protein ACRC51_07930 [Cetobacterium sp.]
MKLTSLILAKKLLENKEEKKTYQYISEKYRASNNTISTAKKLIKLMSLDMICAKIFDRIN